MKTLEAIGSQGSWFADVDGKLLPCVHSHWTKTIENPVSYFDPGPKEGHRWKELIDALQHERRAILTDSHPVSPEMKFKRYGYIALYEISDVRVDASGLRFNFQGKLANVIRRGQKQESLSLGPSIRIEPTRSDIYLAIDRFQQGERPPRFREAVSWFIVDDRTGISYPLKGVWSLAINAPSGSFNTSDAIAGAKRLGFQFEDDEDVGDENDAQEVAAIEQSDMPATTKRQLIAARIGQGIFRKNVIEKERSCRITGVKDGRLLRASHILPWRDADNNQRLDGNNGLLLTPLFDHLFDRGYMSFLDDGRHIFSPAISKNELKRLGLDGNFKPPVRPFSESQVSYLERHRRMYSAGDW